MVGGVLSSKGEPFGVVAAACLTGCLIRGFSGFNERIPMKNNAKPDNCCPDTCIPGTLPTDRYRHILIIALVLNALMFGVELVASWWSGSVSLLADSIDFFGDAVNYGISLAVLAMALAWRSKAAMAKGIAMFSFGVFVLARTGWGIVAGSTPEPFIMGVTAVLAFAVNIGVAWMLYAYREGDANMRSVWLCSRNDAISNIAVFVAALAVQGSGTRWPDLVVALVMGGLALTSGASVMRLAGGELKNSV